MLEIKVIPVASKNDLNRFIKLPWKIYRDYPHWVPPLIFEREKILNREKNPFFLHSSMEMFIALRGKETIGRIAAIKNDRHNKYNNENTGFFGFFECIDDQDAANMLFEEARLWFKSKGLTEMKGPANPSSNDDWGLLTEGFDSAPRFMMPYNPEYYIRLFENYGLTKAMNLHAYKFITERVVQSEKLYRAVDIVKKRYNLEIKKIDMKNFGLELEKVKYIYNNAWAPNWGFVPFTDEEINSIASDLKELIEPSLALFVEIEGKPIAFTLTLPDYNEILKKMNGRLFPFGFIKLLTGKKKIKWTRILTLGIIPEYQKKGIDALIYLELIKNAAKLGVEYGEASWILENNEMMNNALINIGGELYKKYRIYHTFI